MGKKVIVVPPQNVSVNVNVNVGQQPAVPAQPHAPGLEQPQPFAQPAPAAQVNTAVHAGAPAWPGPVALPRGPYEPPFHMPTSDVLRRNIPRRARAAHGTGIADHVHDVSCAEHGCVFLAAALAPASAARPWALLGWLLVALCVWSVQYTLIVPLIWLGAVARSGGAKAFGWFAVLFCGCGPFYSLYYLFSTDVPNSGLTPWGLSQIRRD
jgi:hypothetical protein